MKPATTSNSATSAPASPASAAGTPTGAEMVTPAPSNPPPSGAAEAGKGRPGWAADAAAVAMIALVTLGAYAMEVGPALDRHRARDETAAMLSEHEAQSARLAVTAEQLRHQLDPAGAGAAPEVRLEPASALNGRLAALTDLAVAHALQLDAIEPGKEAPGPTHGTIDIRIAGRGGYRDLAAFVHDARARIPDTGFTDLTVTAPANPAEPASFTVRLVWHTAGNVTGTGK